MTENWPPLVPTHPGTETWSVTDLFVGDLIFGHREASDPLGIATRIAGQRWRHVGALIDVDGEPHVVEIFWDAFEARPLPEFVAAYETVGAARLDLAAECIRDATRLMESQLGSPHCYAVEDVILAGLLALTTRGFFVGRRALTRSLLQAAADSAKALQARDGALSFTCSGFVQWAYNKAGPGCVIDHPRWRSAALWPPQLRSLDDLFDEADDDLEGTFGSASLLELLELTDSRVRGGSVRPRPDQVAEFARVICGAVTGFGVDAPQRLEHDGRWVTPVDLWDSPSVARRAVVDRTRR